MKAKNMANAIVGFLGSRLFFWIIIVFFVLEALWIAVSFRYPLIFDEIFHFPLIQQYSHQLSPWLSTPPLRFPFHIFSYHYLMSWLYRFIELLTSTQMWQVVFLRTLNIAMAAGGLIVFARVFRLIKIKQTYINTALLIFVMLPIVPLDAATINYDNMLFLLTAFYMLLAVKIIRSQSVSWQILAGIIALGCFTSLVKFTFLPIFAASVIYLAILLYHRQGKDFFEKLKQSIKVESRVISSLLILVGFILGVGLFSASYVQSIVRYHTPQPACSQVFTVQQCKTEGVNARNIAAEETKNTRPALPFYQYTLSSWTVNMFRGTSMAEANTYPNNADDTQPALPLMSLLIFLGSIIGVGVLIYSWRALPKNSSWYFLLMMAAVLLFALYTDNTLGYYAIREGYGEQPRYLLSMLPVLLVMVVTATAYVLRKSQWLKIAVFAGVLLLFTQGGGAITHVVRSSDSWYWQRPKIIEANHAAKKILDPLIKQSYGKYGF